MTDLSIRLRKARGKRYFDLLKAILYGPTGQCIVNDAREIIDRTGKFTNEDVCTLMLRYDLNFKAVCEWLEEKEVLPTGTYDKLKRRGLKVGKLLQERAGRVGAA